MAYQNGPQQPPYGPPPGYGYGYPPPPPKRSNTPIILMVAGVAAVLLFGGCAALVVLAGSSTPQVVVATAPKASQPARSDDTPAQPSTNTQPPAATPASAAAVGATLLLEGMDAGLKIDVTVTKVVEKATPANDYSRPKTGNRYVAIELQLTNKGQAVYDDSPSNGAKLIDDQGQQYNSTFGDVREGVLLSSVTITPGDSRKGVILYEIPEAVKLAKFQFGLNSGFASQKGEWNLR
ncbi:hypothetical protein Skr01_51590 [Sphaerisporangium krabiense]|uniref:DUF4352 domain-containing protein n=1 Tax=Sphaerisporangium krabiense TaxID=763782 RepID=A0A7W8Z9X9_9ACTN|nr:DUF4352 domain-containing protein [Sphaerisporangium krabiense]MBB5630124.1 hypothetical protein [Sphaerisporangium krabiense]GII65074.1 hypothetical protein Skr01_51590 [Sphaerisporangium krabiense]